MVLKDHGTTERPPKWRATLLRNSAGHDSTRTAASSAGTNSAAPSFHADIRSTEYGILSPEVSCTGSRAVERTTSANLKSCNTRHLAAVVSVSLTADERRLLRLSGGVASFLLSSSRARRVGSVTGLRRTSARGSRMYQLTWAKRARGPLRLALVLGIALLTLLVADAPMQGSELRESAVAARSKQGRLHFSLRGGSHEPPYNERWQSRIALRPHVSQDDSCPMLAERSYPRVRCPSSSRPKKGEGALTNSRRS
ncbi:hypothetical protein MRX96_011358 [Rhipicephalus microplus]